MFTAINHSMTKCIARMKALTRKQMILLVAAVTCAPLFYWALVFYAEHYTQQLAQWLNAQWAVQVTPLSLHPIFETAVFMIVAPIPLFLGLCVRWVRNRLWRADARL